MKTLKRASPTIMSCIAAVGVVATAVTAIRSTPKAVELIEQDSRKNHKNDPYGYTNFEAVQSAWKCYIPSLTIGIGTIACIFAANGLNKRQQAAITSAYILLDNTFKEYKKKIKELYEESGLDDRVEDAIVKDKYKNYEPIGDGETVIFYEDHYGQFFERTMLQVQKAEYELNRKFAIKGEVSLNDFFKLLKLDETKAGDILGWSRNLNDNFTDHLWIEFEHRFVEMDDGMECCMIDILTPPMADYDVPF